MKARQSKEFKKIIKSSNNGRFIVRDILKRKSIIVIDGKSYNIKQIDY